MKTVLAIIVLLLLAMPAYAGDEMRWTVADTISTADGYQVNDTANTGARKSWSVASYFGALTYSLWAFDNGDSLYFKVYPATDSADTCVTVPEGGIDVLKLDGKGACLLYVNPLTATAQFRADAR